MNKKESELLSFRWSDNRGEGKWDFTYYLQFVYINRNELRKKPIKIIWDC